MIAAERIRKLNHQRPHEGRFVLYWMQSSQRVSWNHALQYAVREANRLDLPLVVLFVIIPGFPDASPGHYRFMVEGLLEMHERFLEKGIRFVIRIGEPEKIVADLGSDAAAVVTDRDYLRLQNLWRMAVSGEISCPFIEVESDVVVPVETASSRDEWSAATFRKKITPLCGRFLKGLDERKPNISSIPGDLGDDVTETADSFLLQINPQSPGRDRLPWRGGETAAHTLLEQFISKRLARYALNRNDPTTDTLSGLSPYLHFGQISPLEVALRVRQTNLPAAQVFLEELIIRRELSVNFVTYNTRYDSFDGLPEWARKTLTDHAGDRREYSYSREEFEQGGTHDPYWNAAQTEMMITGKMHGYMRMYWGKKILEWSETPGEGYLTAQILNNRYELDGRDPNGYAGVAWCFGKHDRPWPERPVFGTIRYMNANGLKRKFNPEQYVMQIDTMKNTIGGGIDHRELPETKGL
jgi:deoxyribodipyrimidine photo-lyase